MSAIVEKNVPIIKVSCNNCMHYHRDNDDAFSCDAFNNIPKEILIGDNMHKTTMPSQKNKIVFEPIK